MRSWATAISRPKVCSHGAVSHSLVIRGGRRGSSSGRETTLYPAPASHDRARPRWRSSDSAYRRWSQLSDSVEPRAARRRSNCRAFRPLSTTSRLVEFPRDGGEYVRPSWVTTTFCSTCGTAYGLDATPETIDLARDNAARADVGNVEFLLGNIEDIPLPDTHVNVVISNCVINLSAGKPAPSPRHSASCVPAAGSASTTSSSATASIRSCGPRQSSRPGATARPSPRADTVTCCWPPGSATSTSSRVTTRARACARQSSRPDGPKRPPRCSSGQCWQPTPPRGALPGRGLAAGCSPARRSQPLAGYSLSSRRRSRLRNAGGPSQSSDIRPANSPVSGKSEFAIASW